jgi:hypothetical protein
MPFSFIQFLSIFPDIEYNFERNLLNWYEIPIVIALFIIINKWIKKSNQKNYKKYFKLFVNLKLAGALIITLLFNLYYVGGDTTAYYNDGRLLNKMLLEHPPQAIKMILASGEPKEWPSELEPYYDGFRFATPRNTWFVCKITALFELITFRSMLASAMLFGFFSALLIWKFYETLSLLYPYAQKYLAYAILFIPSLLLWGSGIFKDTITLCLTLYCFVCMYNTLKAKVNVFKNLIHLLVSIYIVFIIKPYIIVSFLACSTIWLFSLIKIKSGIGKIIVMPILLSLFAGMLYYGFDLFTKNFNEFALEEILETTKNTGNYIKYVSEKSDGSVYDIGTLDPTIEGFLKLAPNAINVTFFRPYIWESKKLIIFFAAIESSMVLLTIFIFIKCGILKALISIFSDPLLLMFFVFALIFSAFVGLSSFNFGTLIRYKIVCIPFYVIILGVIYSKKLVTPIS